VELQPRRIAGSEAEGDAGMAMAAGNHAISRGQTSFPPPPGQARGRRSFPPCRGAPVRAGEGKAMASQG